MPFSEQHYWPRMCGAVLALTYAICFAAWYVSRILPLDQRPGAMLVADAVLAADDVLFLLALAGCWLLQCAATRARQRARHAAMAGYQDALVPSRGQLPGASGASDDGAPITITWTLARWQWVLASLARLLVSSFLVAMFVLDTMYVLDAMYVFAGIYGTRTIFPMIQDFPAFAKSDVSATTHLLVYITLFVGGACVLAFMVVEAMSTLMQGTKKSLSAGTDGLTSVSQYSRRTTIPWHEARLLEVDDDASTVPNETRQPQHHTLYTLFSPTRSISWTGVVFGAVVGGTGDPTSRNQDILRAVIQRTGLIPRTFDLASAPGRAEDRAASRLSWALVVVDAVSFALAIMTIGRQFVPFGACLLVTVAWMLFYKYRGRRKDVDGRANSDSRS